MGEKLKKSRWHAANVLNATPASRHLWQFSVGDKKFSLTRDQTLDPTEAPPEKVVAKSWGEIVKPTLNVAWLPTEQVFLKVVHLPATDQAEAVSMVELQLEKFSPMPVAQIVWSVELLPKRAEDTLQTAIIVIVPRDVVESFLGQLETQKFLADRLELPFLDELLATEIREDGVWIFPGPTVADSYLVAWWYGGLLQNLNLFTPAPEQDLGSSVKAQISQIAWAGELEGWMTGQPQWHLVAEGENAETWKTVLAHVTESSVEVVAPVPIKQVAALSAKRAAKADSVTNLLPAEFALRYRQLFVDRLWMRGLGAAVVLYLVGVMIYFAALQVLKFQQYRVENQVALISQSYTNALKMEARIRVLEERKNLQFAALECWNAVANLLPESVSVDQIYFQRGKTFDLFGTVPQESELDVTDFNSALRKVKVNGEPLFSEVASPSSRIQGSTVVWKFSCKLKSGANEL